MENRLIKFLKFSFVFAIFIFISLFSFTKTASAKTSDHVLHGYAWSDNIGWVSFNCADRPSSVCTKSPYSVVIDYATGKMSGYAWSSNIGWIAFGSEADTGCPHYDSNNSNNMPNCRGTAILKAGAYGTAPFPYIMGWARALSYNSAWDGWISLSCHNYDSIDNTFCDSRSFVLTLPNDGTTAIGTSGGSITGKAWGSTVVGWLDFTNVTVTPGNTAIMLSANPTSVSGLNQSTTLTWESPTQTNYTSCTASNTANDNTWTGSVTTPSGSTNPVYTQTKSVNVPADPTTYTISCTDGSKVDTASVTVDVNYVWDVALKATPGVILENGSSIFNWETSGNVPVGTTCAGINPNGWTTQTGLIGNETLTNIISSIKRTIICTPPSPNAQKSSTASANVLSIVNYGPRSCYRPSDGGPTIRLTVPIADECYISKGGNSTKVGSSGARIFPYGAGDYDISCVGGTGSNTVTVSDTLTATACVPDYVMLPLNMCNGKSGQLTDNAFQPSGPSQYKATIKVDSVPESGFSSQLKYKFTMPLNWKSNGWTITGWSKVGLTDDYESPIVSPGNYNSSFDVIAPNKASANAGLASFSKKTQTFMINGDTNPSLSMVRSASYTICAPEGGSSKPIFIEQ
jgi:hypothetical protein